MDITLIFPHQLFKNHPSLVKGRKVVLIEEWLFFHQYSFHKQKLVLHRASMQYYKKLLTHNGYEVDYIASTEPLNDVRNLLSYFQQKGVTAIYCAEVVDDWLLKRLASSCQKSDIAFLENKTPAFLNTMQEANTYFNSRKTYFQTDFYIAERKKRNILIEYDKHPFGGKWSFDADNRNKFPKTEVIPLLPFPSENEYVKDAQQYVNQHFKDNPGSISNPFGDKNTFYPTTHKEAEQWLQTFLEHRFEKFGVYEDAIVAVEKVLYHSVLSPMLNNGLLEPQYVIDKTLLFASQNDVPLNSVEGFIRQIIGWREFIRIVYQREGRKQRTTNFWNFTRKIPDSFYTGTTGITPIDIVIKRLLQCSYNHHIERLMVLGNFMLLCEFDPNEVHRWFMEMYIDAYDWVMVPNVYGMTQFADGGIMTTKPYISSSNYIKKMSDFPKGEWESVWDALFWRFMAVHRTFFEKNPRIGMLLKTWDKMSEEKKEGYLKTAEGWLAGLDR